MARTQKNKATAFHLGLLKAKLAKYKRELLMPTAKGGGASEPGTNDHKLESRHIELCIGDRCILQWKWL
jgi:ribosome-interacting GTPase 1